MVDVESSFFCRVYSSSVPGSGGNPCRRRLLRVASLLLGASSFRAAVGSGTWCIPPPPHLHQLSRSREDEGTCTTGSGASRNNLLFHWADLCPKETSEPPYSWRTTTPVPSAYSRGAFSDKTRHEDKFTDHAFMIERRYTLATWKLVSGGQHHTLLLSEEGAVFSLGRKEYGRLGLGESTPAGNNDQDKPAPDSLHSWGFGTNGQLGHGGDDDLFEPKAVAGKFAGKKALVVSGGGQHAVILAS
ncbi:hypothetical protein HPB51_005097 [Rhipicephalus microplus]|uniref:Regulator of chromosome condensation (RCC1) repeat-containing protein n=1 Tax=Rhipicephalus microplus TaxID=6941 RepID=A0A9J6E6L5_RHIMP|nr:hypothetical protein HPB51_005097 [Rhipicephalus microplus]